MKLQKPYIPFKLFVVFPRLHFHFVSMTCLWKFAPKPSLHPIRRNEPRSRNSGFSTVSSVCRTAKSDTDCEWIQVARQKKHSDIWHKHRYYDIWYISNSLPERNIAPARKPSQKETGLPTIHFQVLLLMEEILHQLMGSLSRQFTRFCTSQVVVWDFFINSMSVSGRVAIIERTCLFKANYGPCFNSSEEKSIPGPSWPLAVQRIFSWALPIPAEGVTWQDLDDQIFVYTTKR